MENAIVIKEKRGVVEKFKSWYKQKIVDTGYSAASEDVVYKVLDIKKNVEQVTIKVVATILTLDPKTKAVGESVNALTVPFVKISDATTKILQNSTIGVKRFIEAKLIGVDGSSSDVVLSNVNANDFGNDVSTFANKFGSEIKKLEKSTQVGDDEEKKQEESSQIVEDDTVEEELEESKGRAL